MPRWDDSPGFAACGAGRIFSDSFCVMKGDSAVCRISILTAARPTIQ